MTIINTETNLDYLLGPLRLHYGDIDGSLYTEAVYRTALISGVKYLSNRWGGKYYIDTNNNITRNTNVSFDTETPLIEAQDEYAIILAAALILRQVSLTSSASAFVSWSAPDLSISAGGQERVYTKLYENALAELNEYFKKGLGTSRKSFMLIRNGYYPTTVNNQRD